MKRPVRAWLLAATAAAVLAAPAAAYPWGWATHTYLVGRLTGGNGQAIYAGVLPDFPQVMAPGYVDFLQEQSHFKFNRFVGKAADAGLGYAALGFASHNGFRGADSTAHDPSTGYVTAIKAPELVALTGLDARLAAMLEANGVPEADAVIMAGFFASTIAHEAVEYAVDILVKEGPGPGVGYDLYMAALTRDPGVPDVLTDSFANPFAARFRMPLPRARALVSEGESNFRGFMMDYGGLLTLPDRDAIVGLLAAQGAARLHDYVLALTGLEISVPPGELAQVLNAAFFVVWDFEPAVEATYDLLRAEMRRAAGE